MSADASHPANNEGGDMNIRTDIPRHWSPEQALAVFDFLDQICTLVWTRYQAQIIDHLGLPAHTDHPRQLDLFDPDPDDDLPF